MIELRFYDFGEISAKFASKGTCGHDIKKGDRIGYGRRGRRGKAETCCPSCWSAWVNENAEADMMEQNNCY